MTISLQYLRSAGLAAMPLLAMLSITASAAEITIFSAGAVKPALAELAPV